MQRKILIVDDSDVNRSVLRKLLCGEYEITEAEDGRQALDIMERDPEAFSAVLLDIVMPEMDGYEVLTRIRSNERLVQLPVIVTTGNTDEDAEIQALSLGANDYVTKPYKANIIRHRLWNTINLRETAAVANAARRDYLTGLYSRMAFFEAGEGLIAAHEPGYYCMACFDIDNFKVINDQYGTRKGDEVLRFIADTFAHGFEKLGGICCRIMADNFAVLYPSRYMDSADVAALRREAAALDGSVRPITFSIGRYIVDDPSLSVSAMYDRAALAEESVKGRFDKQIALYSESLRTRLLLEQEITSEMNSALEQNQFETWFQPQYNHASGALIGAEALVRWRHPTKGLIPPGVFIPVFERNGFIYELDKFVWEQSCKLLRGWRDAGREPLPVSVNISRYDIFRSDFFEIMTGLITKYAVPVELLRLEITESAFARSTDQIVTAVRQLIDYGFTVEIDDFGSGYSSLNTLKDVPADVLKLDMRFLENSIDSQRGGNILESIVRMSKWLGMSVIAEGVETKEQADYLESIGCCYIQGYLYARPMPASEYEQLARQTAKEEKLLALETVETLDNSAFWDPKSMDTLIFNSYVGGACIFEYRNGKTELLRVNKKYAQALLATDSAIGYVMSVNIFDYMSEDGRAELLDSIRSAVETGEEVYSEPQMINLPGRPGVAYMRVSTRVIARAGDRNLLYSTVSDITSQRLAEQQAMRTAQQMQVILDNAGYGITAVISDGELVTKYLFANDKYYQMLGFTREQYEAEVSNVYKLIHPDDRLRVLDAINLVIRDGASVTIEYRVKCRNGEECWVQALVSISHLDGIEQPVQLCVLRDISQKRQVGERMRELDAKIKSDNEMLLNLMNDTPGGFARMRLLPDGAFRIVYINDGFEKLIGLTKDEVMTQYSSDVMGGVHPRDVARVHAGLAKMFETGEQFSEEYRLRGRNGKYTRVAVLGRITPDEKGERFINLYYTPAPRGRRKNR